MSTTVTPAGSVSTASPFNVIHITTPGCNIGFAVQRHSDRYWYDFSQGVFIPNAPQQSAMFSLAKPVASQLPGIYMASIPGANLAEFTDGTYFVYFCLTRESNLPTGGQAVFIKDGTDVPH